MYYILNEDLVQLAAEDKNVLLFESIAEADAAIIPDCLLIIEDCQLQLENKKTLETVVGYYIRGCHHRKFSCILTLQKCFNPKTKIIVENASYNILFLNCRDKSTINFIGRQYLPTNSRFLQDAYCDATKTPHGFLFMDLRVPTVERYRIRNFILPDENAKLYVPT